MVPLESYLWSSHARGLRAKMGDLELQSGMPGYDILQLAEVFLLGAARAFGDLQETDVVRYAGWLSVGTWFEGLGTLLKFGLIDPNMVYEMMGG